METEAAAVEIAASKGAARISPLREQLSEISLMSGVEFERFTASVFEALGYDATLVGGAGDQGVDLVLRKGAEVVAVQCKNYGQPIGNRPVQEVYAGARHHGIDQAWVVAPRGYTRGAVELARSTGVTLYDRARIEDLVRQAEQRHVASAALQDFDRDLYQTFLKGYSEMLDSLESYYTMGTQHVFDRSLGSEIREQYEQARYSLYGFINGYVQDLATLEGRNLELRADELVASRQRLEARQRKIEQRAKELGVFVEPVNIRNLGVDAIPKQAATVSPRTKVGTEPGTSAADVSARRDLAVGDTAILKAGDTLTVHSYNSPVFPPGYEPQAGYEYSVIDVEVCANAESEERLNSINPDDFTLHMPDKVRLQSRMPSVERRLQYSVLFPGEPLRGLIFFQTPIGEVPRSVIYTGRNRNHVRWLI